MLFISTGKEGAEEDEKDRGLVGDAEPDDRQRNPGHRRDRPQHLQRRLQRLLEQARPADRDAGENAERACQRKAAEDAKSAGERIAQPVPRIGLRGLVEAEHPVAERMQHRARRR
ncbi:hypothetical protein ACVJF1_006622 [Bradyrhizobium diazoefficiens]